jgi:hypothetical protein
MAKPSGVAGVGVPGSEFSGSFGRVVDVVLS